MGNYVAKDFALSTLAGPLTDTSTTATVQAGHGNKFPIVANTDYSYLVLEDAAGNFEVIGLTAHATNADSMTIARGQMNTAARSWAAGTIIECRPLAQIIADSFNHMFKALAAHAASAITNTPDGNITSQSVQDALNELDTITFKKTGGAVTGDVAASGNVTAGGALAVAGQASFNGSPGTKNKVLLSQGPGAAPQWGNLPALFTTSSTGIGDLLISENSTGAMQNVIGTATYGNGLVDYSISDGANYETGIGKLVKAPATGAYWNNTQNGFVFGAGLRRIRFLNNLYVAVGVDGTIATSPDAVTWTQQVSGVQLQLNDVTYFGGKYYVVGNSECILSSPDAITWTLVNIRGPNSGGGALYNLPGTGKTVLNPGTGTNGQITTDGGISWSGTTYLSSLVSERFNNAGIDSYATSACGNGLTVRFLTNANIRYVKVSADGLGWEVYKLPYPFTCQHLLYANGMFVVIGSAIKGTGPAATNVQVVLTSTDGANWTERATVAGTGGLAWNGSVFSLVLLGNSTCYTSPDGITWTARTFPTATGQFYVGAIGTRFVAVQAGAAQSYYSTDGINWTGGTGPGSAWSGGIRPVSNGSVIVTCNIAGGSTSAASSSDGITWTARTLPVGLYPAGIVWNGASFVLTGYDTNSKAVILTSADGITWTDRSSSVGLGNLTAIAASGAKMVAVGDKGLLYTSTDGTAWSRSQNATFGVTASMVDVAYDGTGTWVAVKSSTANDVYQSTDGSTWTLRTSNMGANAPYAVTFGAGKWALVGSAGNISYSSDGITWTAITAVSTYHFTAVTFSGSKFLAVGNTGLAATSPDGVNWSLVTPASGSLSYTFTAYGTGGFVVGLGMTGSFITSPDAVTWTVRGNPFGNRPIYKIVTNGTVYVAVSGNGLVASSADGVTWTLRTTTFTTADQVYTAIYAGGQFVIAGSLGKLSTSPDGITWTQRTSAATAMANDTIADIAHNGSNLYCIVGVSASGTIATSPDGITWTGRTAPVSQAISWVVWFNSRFVAGPSTFANGENFFIASEDGVTWTYSSMAKTTLIGSATLNVGTVYSKGSPAIHDGKLWLSVAAGNVMGYGAMDVSVLSSSDGAAFNIEGDYRLGVQGFTGVASPYQKVGGVYFLPVARPGTFAVSYDELNTRTTTLTPRSAIYGFVSGNGKILAYGDLGYIGYSQSANDEYFLKRISIIASSNSNAVVPFGAGAKSLVLNNSPAPEVGTVVESSVAPHRGTWALCNGGNIDAFSYPAYRALVPLTGGGTGFQKVLHSNFPTALASNSRPYATSWNGTVFLAVPCIGAASTTEAFTSADGVTWVRRTLPVSSSFVLTANTSTGMFVLFPRTTTTTCYTSTDGVNWTPRTCPSFTAYDLTCNGTTFVATTSAGTSVLTSTDGITWSSTAATLGNMVGVYGTSFYSFTTGATAFYTSANGTTWGAAATLPDQASGIAWNGTVFCLIPNTNPTSTCYTSTTGGTGTWTARTLPVSTRWASVHWTGALFLAFSMQGYGGFATSADGITWSSPAAMTPFLGQNQASRGAVTGNGVTVVAAAVFYQGVVCDLNTSQIALPNITTRSTLAPPRVRIA